MVIVHIVIQQYFEQMMNVNISHKRKYILCKTFHLVPPPVTNLHLIRATMTAARIVWDIPDLSGCNSFKGYQIYLDDVEYECTTECGITISSLTASTCYQIDVCIVTNKGKGPRMSVNIVTASAGEITLSFTLKIKFRLI